MSNLSDRFTKLLAKMPMAMVVIPFAIGIFFAEQWCMPWWLLITTCIVALAGAISLSKGWQNIAIFVAIFAVGAIAHSLSYQSDIPYNKPLEIVLKLETSSAERNGYTSAEAKIEQSEERSIEGKKVVLWGDSLIRFKAGDRLHLTTPIRPFRAERRAYAELMHHRQIIGSVSVNHRATYEYIPATRVSLHDWAVGRLQSALKPSDARAVVLAMTTGDKGEIRSELRDSYSASGTSHLLAVSGLHIGIAFMLINLLLLPLVLLRYGNVVRSVAAVALIWIYVWLCGMSPSAMRAAIMFSLLQFSLSSLREYVSVNILAGTAFIMLVFDSHLLFDISFQLSFIAVAGIVLWAMPLYRLCATRYKVVNTFVAILLVGIASTIATMPLVARTFGTISLVGVLINPAVIVLANIVVFAGVISLIIPPVAVVAEWAAEWQNHIVEWGASLRYGHFDLELSDWAMWGAILLFTVVTITILLLPKRKKAPKIEG
ncbi:MAG: ComEC/Rec2 family competence protein [Alistipes sp.]|nr:ComEC/Rec2 family competence protein [Alistipes sp.]